MEDLIQDFDNIISASNNQINDKILGINYLEKLKYLLIDKLKTLNISNEKNFKNFEQKEIKRKLGDNDLLIKFIFNTESLSKMKTITPNDYLSIVLFGFKSLEIHRNLDFKKSQSLNLFPKTGIVISKDTLISESISKDTILLDIFNIKNDKVIVN